MMVFWFGFGLGMIGGAMIGAGITAWIGLYRYLQRD